MSTHDKWLVTDETGKEYGTMVANTEATAVYMKVQESAEAFSAQALGRSLQAKRIATV